MDRYAGLLMYDLPCVRGPRVLATAPQIIRAIRHAKGQWAQLGST